MYPSRRSLCVAWVCDMANLESDIATFFSKSPYYLQKDIGVRIATDIMAVVQTFRFAHKVTMWGETSQCKLCIYGPLPFQYNKMLAAVPVQIWITQNYPVDPPSVYVVPSSSTHQVVLGHRAVDGSGLCFCPHLAKWNPQTSTIKPVLLQLIKIFSNFPPLWDDKDAANDTPSASNTASSAAAALLSLVGGSSESDADARLCVVCLSDPKDTVLVPCGHCCSCSTCAASLATCPMCRSKIQLRQRVYV